MLVCSPAATKSPPEVVQFTLVFRLFQLASPLALFRVFSVQSLVSRWMETFRGAVAVPPILERVRLALNTDALVGMAARLKRTNARFSWPLGPLRIRFVAPPKFLPLLLLSM